MNILGFPELTAQYRTKRKQTIMAAEEKSGSDIIYGEAAKEDYAELIRLRLRNMDEESGGVRKKKKAFQDPAGINGARPFGI